MEAVISGEIDMVVTIFSPAKINLYLAITGRRADGFHDLVSVVAPLDFGDELRATSGDRKTGERFQLKCNCPEVPVDQSNLVLKAAAAFAEATGWPRPAGQDGGACVDFDLVKRIPVGAGLGGGSSNAVAALRALNELSGGKLKESELGAIAATLGSDCALFLQASPVIMRGRGERIEVLPDEVAKRLRGQRVLLFKPSFGISTPWAYGRMAAEAPRHYLPEKEAEEKLATWTRSDAPLVHLLFNSMEGVAFEKFVALPVLLEQLRREFGVEARMSGSGSSCFALLDSRWLEESAGKSDPIDVVMRMKQFVRERWGETVFVQECALL